MNASLYFYKGYQLRSSANPALSAWFDAMETRETYRGTQSDFHTHSNDLPPQMGGCYPNGTEEQRRSEAHIMNGPRWDDLPDARFPEPGSSRAEAVHRVSQFRAQVVAAAAKACRTDPEKVDEALRCALTLLSSG